jgi:orotidine-5'-phosphate decarboxylase
MSRPADRILVALDVSDFETAFRLFASLTDHVGGFKVGKELFVAAGFHTDGRDFIDRLVEQECNVFLDMKFHDIPNTVAGAVRAATRAGVWMLNVHASGGREMMRAAVQAAHETSTRLGKKPPLVVAVTVLTSLNTQDLHEIGLVGTPEESVLRLSVLAKDCGVDGVVASAQEAAAIKRECGADFLVVSPGIRPAGGDPGDQKRLSTPGNAVRCGCDYLVIGRPITQAKDPVQAAVDIAAEIAAAASR